MVIRKLNTYSLVLVFGIASAVLVQSCGKDGPDPGEIDFTLDLNDSKYSGLKNNGGIVYKNDIIIVKTSNGDYVALSQICTYALCTVTYDEATNTFPCPCDNSRYTEDGNVLFGPAGKALFQYNTEIAGNYLRIIS
ncbi:MAG: Rieske 2Fe-2S domain-containing protein [Bacteroidetes bacterium]|nr:Rieske 2Fe-2S domain-containing protein [Bacteroidota bacterium]